MELGEPEKKKKTTIRNEFACLVMGTIFLVSYLFYYYALMISHPIALFSLALYLLLNNVFPHTLIALIIH